MSVMASQEIWMFTTGKFVDHCIILFLRFDRVNDLHFRIQTDFGQFSSKRVIFKLYFSDSSLAENFERSVFDYFQSNLS